MAQKVEKESSGTGYLELSGRKYRGHKNENTVVEKSAAWM